MASVHVPSLWEHALGLSADLSQDPFLPHRHSGGEGVSWTWYVLDPFAHGLCF